MPLKRSRIASDQQEVLLHLSAQNLQVLPLSDGREGFEIEEQVVVSGGKVQNPFQRHAVGGEVGWRPLDGDCGTAFIEQLASSLKHEAFSAFNINLDEGNPGA